MAEGELQRTFGAALRAYRLARGFSQETFADQLGVHRTYLGGVERGERNLTLCSVERLCGRINVNPLGMLHGPGDPPPHPLAPTTLQPPQAKPC